MPESLLNQPSESTLEKVISDNKYDSGHIATCYNFGEKKVIQAGSSTGVLIWNGAQTAHVYLGYILNVE